MHPEITDNNTVRPVGWIYFDAACRFCAGQRRRWGRIFERRGFVWLPLQTPGAAGRLGVADAQLREEMWLQLADGRTFGGVDAWGALMRRVWWLWPPRLLLTLPGCRTAARLLYRWIAENRHCLGGACTLHPHRRMPPSGRRSRLVAGLMGFWAAVFAWPWGAAPTGLARPEPVPWTGAAAEALTQGRSRRQTADSPCAKHGLVATRLGSQGSGHSR